jgi:hypothetical protein
MFCDQKKHNILFELCFGGYIMELITFKQIVYLTVDSCSIHIQSTLMMEAASSTEILVTVIQTKGDILESSLHLNRDNFKPRASFILCFMRCL